MCFQFARAEIFAPLVADYSSVCRVLPKIVGELPANQSEIVLLIGWSLNIDQSNRSFLNVVGLYLQMADHINILNHRPYKRSLKSPVMKSLPVGSTTKDLEKASKKNKLVEMGMVYLHHYNHFTGW